MASSRQAGDLIVTGNLSVGGSLGLPAGSVGNSNVAAAANIDADKLEHLYKPVTHFDLPVTGTPVAREEHVFIASGVGAIRAFKCLLTDTGTTTNIDFDLKVNGVSVLSAAVNFTEVDVDGVVKSGTINAATLAADDRVSISLAVTTSAGAQGPVAWLELTEGAN